MENENKKQTYEVQIGSLTFECLFDESIQKWTIVGRDVFYEPIFVVNVERDFDNVMEAFVHGLTGTLIAISQETTQELSEDKSKKSWEFSSTQERIDPFYSYIYKKN